METIRLFMWGFQGYFHDSVEGTAKRIFQELDKNYEVEAFLLGLRREERPQDYEICLEPEECGFDPKVFSSVRKDSEDFRNADPESSLMTTDESHMRSIQRRVEDRSERKAVLKALVETSKASGEFLFSGFTVVSNYDVGVVLRLTHRYGVTHYRLSQVRAKDRYRVPSSLTAAVADLFLGHCRKSLYVPHPEFVADWDGPETRELLRKAGDRLMEAPIFATGGIEGLYGLFDACNYISSLTYESATSVGAMFVAKKGHPNIQSTLTLAKPVPLHSHRAIRKLLEITSAGDAILTDGASVTGFGRIIADYDLSEADVFKIEFTGHQKWEIQHGDHKLMRVAYGNPALPLPSLDPNRFKSDAERIFKGISAETTQNLLTLSEEACRQRHGTVLVITPEAASEAKRLASQATGIVPISLTPELLRSVTAIDGAVMLDTNGVCHAIGVILDGEAVEFGDPARGARYNSSLRYTVRMGERNLDCLVVVVSEDGTAEWIPELRPRLSRRILKFKEIEADTILAAKEFPISRTSGLLIWLSDHRFYLSQSICDKANRLEEQRLRALKAMVGVFYSPHKKFEPQPGMSEDYLED